MHSASTVRTRDSKTRTEPAVELARRGAKFSQFYNCGKCEPSRAALITGHQFWTHDPNVAIRKDSPNFGEIIQAAGYRTMMVGKWHAAGDPFQRGFHRHFGFMTGGCDFFLGNDTFTLDGKPWTVLLLMAVGEW